MEGCLALSVWIHCNLCLTPQCKWRNCRAGEKWYCWTSDRRKYLGSEWQDSILSAEGTYSLQGLEVNTLLPLPSLPGLAPSSARWLWLFIPNVPSAFITQMSMTSWPSQQVHVRLHVSAIHVKRKKKKGAPSLEVLKAMLDRALSNLVWRKVFLLMAGVSGTRSSSRSLPAQAILWFYEETEEEKTYEG